MLKKKNTELSQWKTYWKGDLPFHSSKTYESGRKLLYVWRATSWALKPACNFYEGIIFDLTIHDRRAERSYQHKDEEDKGLNMMITFKENEGRTRETKTLPPEMKKENMSRPERRCRRQTCKCNAILVWCCLRLHWLKLAGTYLYNVVFKNEENHKAMAGINRKKNHIHSKLSNGRLSLDIQLVTAYNNRTRIDQGFK